MSRPLDRDDEIDALLRQTLGAAAGPVEDCPDVELLGAYAEGGLARLDRSRVEAHAADCGRCQDVLAALARTDSLLTHGTVAPVPGWRRLFAPVWAVPVAILAVAAGVWLSLEPRRQPVELAQAGDEVSRLEPPGVARGAPHVSPSEAAPGAPSTPPAAKAGPPPPASEERSRLQAEPGADLAETIAPSPAPVPPLPDRRDQPQGQTGAVAGSRAAPLPGPPPGASASPPVPAAEAAVQANEALQKTEPAGISARITADASAFVSTRRVLSPDPDRMWMLGPRGTVQRSTDGGLSFQAQPTNTTARLTAAAAPGPDVCWIVGDDGLVLLTTDGLTWRRVDLPVQTALISVAATSAADASVTAADGRSWITTDGGRSWTARQR